MADGERKPDAGETMPPSSNEKERPSDDSRHDPRDEFTLLCERCGYVIAGLDPGGKCPECGTPIEDSTPAIARPGSPWQLKPSAACVITTMWAMTRRPGTTLRRMRIDGGTRGLGIGMCAIASGTLVAPVVVLLLIGRLLDTITGALGPSLLAAAGLMLLTGFAVLVLLMLLTYIEDAGIQMYGRVHGRRITSAVAETVCAHACVGWLTGAVLFWVALAVAMLVGDEMLGVVLAPIALFLGLLHFEVLVWMGVRRCRYANRERTAIQRPAPDQAAAREI